ncbi:MAG: hypothetical protein BJ554DRAFT_3623 [Olpidium bornovanus]|uniref:Uncharacterized protein n=1 Tax=Olpidium bornovanus TaxID=278681 RepID=A0A8H7ZNW4_9FUNG|nr:MAG: hypothetical protein BJ554DRAFT_3623 [Olpidium bornovanus]
MFAQDRDGWTVLHHAVRMAGLASMETAARYYMERLVDLIVLNFEDLFPLVDISDANGDTALALAAKLGDRRLVLVLLKAGGDPTIKNKMNKSADDYATEYLRRGGGEAGPAARGRFGDVFCVGGRPEPPPAPGGETAPAATAGRAFPTLDGLGISGLAACDFAGGAGPLAAGQGAAAAGAAASSAVSREIARTNAELGDVVRMLARIRQDAEDARRTIRTMQPETDRIPELRSQVRELEAELRRTIYHNQRLKVRSLVHQLSDQPAQAPRNRRDLLEELHAKSRPKEGLLADAASMRDALAALLRDRRELVEDAVRLRAECGGPRCNLYRGLIAKCCDVAPDEVDGMVQPMLELLQSAAKGERDLPPRPLRPPQPRPLPGHQTSPAAAGLFIESAAGGRGTRVL